MRDLTERLRRVHELLRVFHGIGDGLLRVIGGVGRLLRVEQSVEQVTEVDQAVVHLLIPGQQVLHHVGLVGDEVIHAQLQHVGGDLFAVDGPGRDSLAPQMDGVDHAGGDKGGLHAEKVGIGQVVVVAYAQSQNVAGGVLRGQRLDLVQGLVALGD